ncbi:splicing factor 3A subunit 3-like [Onychostoma macrolepis]|uniref:splicing factor 3A subunit 3-like n=1 Tax=Onychostoma macrolepis TaxID=369639 RepID=UPI00272C9BDB|nr:splicing factor 3A subunit 3-like [Onychostoma macrolepis]
MAAGDRPGTVRCVLQELRHQINSYHRVRAMLDRYMEVGANLRDLYEDKDGMRKDELNAISGPNEFAEFYNRLKQIKDLHRKHLRSICVPMSVEFEELMKAKDNPSEEAQSKSVYLEMLLEYLQEYTDRVKPLLDQNELYGKILIEFEKKWESGVFPGWPYI